MSAAPKFTPDALHNARFARMSRLLDNATSDQRCDPRRGRRYCEILIRCARAHAMRATSRERAEEFRRLARGIVARQDRSKRETTRAYRTALAKVSPC